MTPRVQKRIDAFFEWEARGRGRLLWGQRVRLEPPFVAFDREIDVAEPVDDGKIETLGSKFASWLTGSTPGQISQESESGAELSESEGAPELDESEEPVTELEIALPQSSSVSRELAEQFLLSLQQCRFPISFEVIGKSNRISIQFSGRVSDVSLIRRQLEAHFPDVTVIESATGLGQLWADASPSLIFDLCLEREFMVPLISSIGFSNDPLTGIVGALTDLRHKEVGLLQILFEPVRQPWASSMLRAVTNGDGSSFFSNAPELLAQARAKTHKPLYAIVCRIAAQSDNYDRVLEIATGIAGALSIVNDPTGNELIPLNNDSYEFDLHVTDLLERRTHRSGMILSSAELVTLVHLPNSTVRIPKLVRDARRTKAAPHSTEGNPIVLGENQHAGVVRTVTVNDEQRLRHTHVIGSSGSGKSTFLINQIRQDIDRGGGLAVFDPHGDLIDQVIGYIPKERYDDVILFDPSDEAFPIGFNILSAHSEREKNLLASDLVSVFQRLSTSWGDQMTAVLRNAILAMLESSRGGTLLDLRRFLVEPEFRENFLESVTDFQVVYFWKKEFTMLPRQSQGPLLTRLNTFLAPRLIRNMVSQRQNRIDFAEVMDGGKIFLAKLSQGEIGEENSYLMGSLLVAKFYQLVMSRQAMEVSSRRHFWLYIDEFHNFVCSSMASILTGARKYRLGLTLAHQELKQIEHRDSNVSGAVLANPYTRICFRLGDDDARKLGSGFSYFEPRDLQNLGVGEAICRIERSDYDFNLKVPFPSQIPDEIAKKKRSQIQELSRKKYASAKTIVEEQIEKEQEGLLDGAESKVRVSEKPEASATLTTRPTRVPETESTISREPRSADEETMHHDQKGIGEDQAEQKEDERHESIKERIRRIAEHHDFIVTTEHLVLEGSARIDVVLIRGTRRIAIQIGITTPAKHEAANIKKCLDAGFEEVYMIALTRKRLDAIKVACAPLIKEADLECVKFSLPGVFYENIDGWAGSASPSDKPDPKKPRKQKFDFSQDFSAEEHAEIQRKMLEKLSAVMRRTKDDNG